MVDNDEIKLYMLDEEVVEEKEKDNKDMCILCLERESNAVILDCGHANICFLCAFKVYKTN